MKKVLLGLLIIGVAFAMGCKKEETASPTTPGMPGATGAPTTPGMPGATGAPTTPGMPGATGAPTTPGMPGATGMPGDPTGMTAPAAAPTEAAPAEMTKTLEKQFPNATIQRDSRNNEVRVFIDPEANVLKEKSKNLSELQCREIALEFIRAQYYYFDTMSFEYRPSAGKLSDGVYIYQWVQIIRETKKTGNTIYISVNPKTGKVAKYKSTRQTWDN